ncbi:unnamed protein product [Rotaria socialis]
MMLTTSNGHQFNAYFTDRWHEPTLMHDCLYYNSTDDFPDYEGGWHGLSQIIQYCIRPEPFEVVNSALLNVHGTVHTFNELRQQQVTSQQLCEWSAPVDLAEDYQVYLDNPNELFPNQTFNNCTRPWFGQFCQFRFDEDKSLSDIVKMSLASKSQHSENAFEITNLTCYMHLNCRTGPEPRCLDWRDVCDGKIDCMNGNDDERYCVELEISICGKDEFQFHNGQCIPMEFYRNDRANPDCLDGSDEKGSFACSEDPTMRCEDRSSGLGFTPELQYITFNCGDGNPVDIGDSRDCEKGRLSLFTKTIFSKINNPFLTIECWSAMIDSLEIKKHMNIGIQTNSPCQKSGSRCNAFISAHCPTLFAFPFFPTLFGHIYLYYSQNQSIDEVLASRNPIKPHYVCYNEQLCPFLTWTIRINGSTCRLFNGFSQKSDWFGMLKDLASIFWTYTTNNISEQHCKNDGFYQCKNSTKCILNRRLTDGFVDCIDGSDESSNYSCTVNDDLRFSCSSENKCLSHLLWLDGYKDCYHGEDEISPETSSNTESISFGTLCDGFIEINLNQYIVNTSVETDETNCDHWPCSNIYTRCDGFWNCKNGADELNCTNLSSKCLPNEFVCVLPESFSLGCLPAIRAGDEHVDSFGGSDERFYCRNKVADDPDKRYRCSNSTKCIDIFGMCRFKEMCPFGDDDRFCESSRFDDGLCFEYTNYPELEHYPNYKLFCALGEASKPSVVHFALTRRKRGATETSTISHQENVVLSWHQNHYTKSLQVAWLCNRGLLTWHLTHEKLVYQCLCSQAYYGSRCQFQSQRLSLSLSWWGI